MASTLPVYEALGNLVTQVYALLGGNDDALILKEANVRKAQAALAQAIEQHVIDRLPGKNAPDIAALKARWSPLLINMLDQMWGRFEISLDDLHVAVCRRLTNTAFLREQVPGFAGITDDTREDRIATMIAEWARVRGITR